MLITVNTLGVAKAITGIQKFRGALKKDAPEYIGEEAVKVLKSSRSLVPVRTGLMKDGIFYKVSGDNVEIGTSAPYGENVEYAPTNYRQSRNRSLKVRGSVKRTLERDDKEIFDRVVGRFKNG